MHVRTQVRQAVRKRLIDGVPSLQGRVYTRHPAHLQSADVPIAIVRSVKGDVITSAGVPYQRFEDVTEQVMIVVFAPDDMSGAAGQNGEPTLAVDYETRVDRVLAEIEPAMKDLAHPLEFVSIDNTIVALNERDVRLLSRGTMVNPETGEETYGAVHLLYEIIVTTVEGRPAQTIVTG